EGPSSLGRNTPEQQLALAAQQRLVVRAAPDGTPQHLTGEGGATATLFTAGSPAPLHLAGDTLDVDRTTHTAELNGHASARQGEGASLRSIEASEFLRAVTDERDELRLVQARGQLLCRLGAVEVRG